MNTVQNADPKNPSINQLPQDGSERAYQTIAKLPMAGKALWVGKCRKYRDALVQEYHKYPALSGSLSSDFMDDKVPARCKRKKCGLKMAICFLDQFGSKRRMDRAVQYVVYCFDEKEKVNIDDASAYRCHYPKQFL